LEHLGESGGNILCGLVLPFASLIAFTLLIASTSFTTLAIPILEEIP
jgi:hypothetical protein